MSHAMVANLVFIMIASIWGLTFPLIRLGVRDIDPYRFLALRFVLATLVFVAWVGLKRLKSQTNKRVIFSGFFLGAILWASCLAQTMALRTLESGRAAFITAMSVILVPFLSPLFKKSEQGLTDWLATAGCVVGLYFLTDPRGGGISSGDILVSTCAVAIALHTHFIQIFLNQKQDPILLAFYQVAGMALFYILTLPFVTVTPVHWSSTLLVSLLVCSLFATVGAFVLQCRYQPSITPERAALFLSLEPVFGALFGYLLLSEVMERRSILGCTAILLSILANECWKLRKTSHPRE